MESFLLDIETTKSHHGFLYHIHKAGKETRRMPQNKNAKADKLTSGLNTQT
jgi:hypothetical protein